MSVAMLQCCGETEAELVYGEPQPAGLHCLLPHSKHSLQFPLVGLVVFFFFFQFFRAFSKKPEDGIRITSEYSELWV